LKPFSKSSSRMLRIASGRVILKQASQNFQAPLHCFAQESFMTACFALQESLRFGTARASTQGGAMKGVLKLRFQFSARRALVRARKMRVSTLLPSPLGTFPSSSLVAFRVRARLRILQSLATSMK
jgi:hypothetical protein